MQIVKEQADIYIRENFLEQTSMRSEIRDAYESGAEFLKKMIDPIIQKHKDRLKTIKENLSHWEEEGWSEADIKESEKMIKVLASILSDLNKVLS